MYGIGELIKKRFGLNSAEEWTRKLAEQNHCLTAVDIGCGTASPLTLLRPGMKTAGIDSSAASIAQSRAAGAHDFYIEADILKEPDLASLLPKEFDGKADIVALYGVIEHFTKATGLELLAKCESIARRFVVLETPNGFVPQGPEFGNEHQRHLSGWFPHDFEGHGFFVIGSTGTRYLRGYGAALKHPIRGLGTLDVVLSRLLRLENNPQHAFNLFAYKDMLGTPARLT